MSAMVEPVLGWRVWRLTPDFQLASLTSPCIWPPARPMRAICSGGGWSDEGGPCGRSVPVWLCACGLYAKKDALPVWDELFLPANYVIGQVSLWGRIIEHERGWRAEYGYPYDLLIRTYRSDGDQIAGRIRSLYAVDALAEPNIQPVAVITHIARRAGPRSGVAGWRIPMSVAAYRLPDVIGFLIHGAVHRRLPDGCYALEVDGERVTDQRLDVLDFAVTCQLVDAESDSPGARQVDWSAVRFIDRAPPCLG